MKHVVVDVDGRPARLAYGSWITFAVRHLAKLVPPFRSRCRRAQVTPFKRALAEGSAMTLKPSRPVARLIAFLQYTGGTTGLSKGAVLTHGNVVAAILQAEAWFTPALDARRSAQANTIAALPLYHIFALTICLLAIRWGSHLTLVPNPRDINRFVEVLKRRPFHIFPAVNTLFNALMHHPQFAQLDFSQLALARPVAWPPRKARREWHKLTGCAMIEGWGMSETCAIGTNNPSPTRIHRQHRPAPAFDRHRDQGRRRATRCRRASPARSASAARSDARLLQQTRRDRRRVHAPTGSCAPATSA